MYTPRHFSEADQARIATFLQENAFGVLVAVVDGRALASHVPFLHDPAQGKLLGHLARENPQWESLTLAQEVMVIFQGPHAYVSPSWYHSAGVPTWNYAAVHVHGEARTFNDSERLQALVDALTDKYESGRAAPWSGPYNPRLLEQIVGVEIRITDIQAKFKLSQNRSLEERRSVALQLSAEGPTEGQRLARMMKDSDPKT